MRRETIVDGERFLALVTRPGDGSYRLGLWHLPVQGEGRHLAGWSGPEAELAEQGEAVERFAREWLAGRGR